MRIAVVYDCFFPLTTGGGERQYRLFAEEFHAAGHDVDYLTRRQWDGEAPTATGLDVVAVSGRIDLYDDRGNRRLGPALRFALDLWWYLLRRRARYDAVLVSALPVLNVFATRLALAGTPVRVCADFLEVWRRAQWIEYSGPLIGRLAAWLQAVAARAAPLVSCHSQMNGRRLTDLRARRPPIVSPGLIDDLHRGEPRLAPVEPPTVVYVGRHIPDKQVETIPGAVAWARERIPNLRATILGEGQTRTSVIREVERLGLTGVVDLPGFVSQARLEEHLRTASCLVNPSRREGYGLVVVEACSMGTPVVLVDAIDNASVELVEPGTNGFVARSTAPEDLGSAIVAAVRAGAGLRRSTRQWYDRAVQTRTAAAAARGILEGLATLHP